MSGFLRLENEHRNATSRAWIAKMTEEQKAAYDKYHRDWMNDYRQRNKEKLKAQQAAHRVRAKELKRQRDAQELLDLEALAQTDQTAYNKHRRRLRTLARVRDRKSVV